MAVYLDCAATTPVDPRVLAEVQRILEDDTGNAGSRTHAFGRRARALVEQARDRVATLTGATRGDVLFTSGATESNNLALLGLAPHGRSTGRTHIVTTRIEHHAVLEPLAELECSGFAVDRVAPGPDGAVEAADVLAAVRPNTLLVSVMHANNETGVIQPVESIADGLADSGVFLHVDAAQTAGCALPALRHPAIDLLSLSGHKMYAPQGVGALIARRRNGDRPPLAARTFGGGQERGLRPGTLPVALIAGLGLAAALAREDAAMRRSRCLALRQQLLEGLAPLEPLVNGDPDRTLPHVVNVTIPGVDAEAAIEAWEDLVAVSHGAACTTQAQTCSHVLAAMGITGAREEGALRLSWCHATPLPDLAAMVEAVAAIRPVHGSLAG
jgi:cysteine desulfurase